MSLITNSTNVYPDDMTLMGQALTFGDPKLIEDGRLPAHATTFIDAAELDEGEKGKGRIWFWVDGYPTRYSQRHRFGLGPEEHKEKLRPRHRVAPRRSWPENPSGRPGIHTAPG